MVGLFSRKKPKTSKPGPSRGRAGEPDYAKPSDYSEPPQLKLRDWDYGRGLDGGKGFGFETHDGRIWAAKNCGWSQWEGLGVLVFNVVGEQFHKAGSGEFAPGSPLKLVPEPKNQHDPKAISVRDAGGREKAGYVKKGNTSRLRNLLKEETSIGVMALSVTPGMDHPELKVVVFRDGALAGVGEIPTGPLKLG